MTPHHLAVLAIIITVSHAAVRNQPQPTTTRPPPTMSVVTVRAGATRAPDPPSLPPSPPPPPVPTACTDGLGPASTLARLRSAMRETPQTLDAFIVFYSDEHLSEEPATEERRLEYISGWDGAGTAAVLADAAAVWVPSGDVRRANASLSCAWTVWDADELNQPTVADWIAMNLRRNGRVGGDARLTSWGEWQAISSALQSSGLQLVPFTTLDQLWTEEPDPERRRPDYSRIVATEHNQDYIGMSWREKVALLRKELQSSSVDAMVVTALDEVAWLLNIRGRDLPYAPLLKAFVIVSLKDLQVYAQPGKLSMPVRDILAVYNCYSNNNCTRVNEYNTIYKDLRRSSESKILIPTGGTFQRGASAAIVQSVPQTKRVFQLSPIIYLKAQKNMAEINGMRRAHLRDAVAMCTLLSYLEGMVKKGGLTELSVAMKVDITRATQANYVGAAMKTRAAFGPSGADAGYRAANTSNRRVYANSTLVIQSGGQYIEGTAVVTRTLHYGIPSREMRLAYTTVLRSTAALATLQVPATLPAAHADPVVRAPLWLARQDYSHPTGHGVGAALNTREDPVVIDYRQDTNLHTFREGYFITSEPAWYERNKFGVKLGNVLEVMIKPEGCLGFREATLLPFEPKLIDKSLLTEYEIMWLNAYNDRIRKIVGPELKDQGLLDVYYWMSNKTVPIDPPSKIVKKIMTNSVYSVADHVKITAVLTAVCHFLVYLL